MRAREAEDSLLPHEEEIAFPDVLDGEPEDAQANGGDHESHLADAVRSIFKDAKLSVEAKLAKIKILVGLLDDGDDDDDEEATLESWMAPRLKAARTVEAKRGRLARLAEAKRAKQAPLTVGGFMAGLTETVRDSRPRKPTAARAKTTLTVGKLVAGCRQDGKARP